MEPFTYSPLDASHIRLVRVDVSEDQPLSATIEHYHLDPADPVTYTAVSYVWGDPESTVSMKCNGKDLPITITLNEALREVVKYSTNPLLWIDQICINQKDNKERSAQVQIMTTIFQSELCRRLEPPSSVSGANKLRVKKPKL